MYELPPLKIPTPWQSSKKSWKKNPFWMMIFIIAISSVFGFLAGLFSSSQLYLKTNNDSDSPGLQKIIQKERVIEKQYISQDSQEQSIIKAVEFTSPAVVSIILFKDTPVYEQYYEQLPDSFGSIKIPKYREKGTEKKKIGGGTGFIVSSDGIILTNKHVITNKEAEFTVFTNNGQKFDAKFLDQDPLQDLAIIKIEKEQIINQQGEFIIQPFPEVILGDSDELKIGQTVIAIGNALGEFRNTVSVGVISGLERTITASGGGITETLEGIIQTDAAINSGNSGGPLLNLKGKVIGINVAKSGQGENIAFAIPINAAKKDIEQIKTLGRIAPVFLGIYYTSIDANLKEEFNLPVDYGAWIGHGNQGQETETAIFPDSAAEKSGLQRHDIVLEFGGQKITSNNILKKIIREYNPGDEVILNILRNGKAIEIIVVLGELND